MAGVALVDSGVGFACDGLGDFFEVLHIVAGRGLVALCAVHGTGGRVDEFGDRPLFGAVALHAVIAEEFRVAIVVLMTGDTV